LPRISIIIPTYNEADNLPLLLSDLLTLKKKGEIIIIDCGSNDKTLEIAKIYGVKILKSNEKNRGLQLSIGANNAAGEWFVFLHADSRLKKAWVSKIRLVLNDDKSLIYSFKFRINSKKIIYRFLEILVNLRTLFFKTPYGDQGLIIHRETYFKNNGYSKIPLMEDLELIRRLKIKNNLRILNSAIFTSPRKWENSNIFLQAIKNWNFRRRWLKGEPIKAIYNDYYKNS